MKWDLVYCNTNWVWHTSSGQDYGLAGFTDGTTRILFANSLIGVPLHIYAVAAILGVSFVLLACLSIFAVSGMIRSLRRQKAS